MLVLRKGPEPGRINSIAAIHALVRRGVKIRTAKRAVETMIEKGEAVVAAPTVEPGGVLVQELRAAGLEPNRVTAGPVDITALRARLGMTQEEFALRYNFNLRALQNWEQGREPDALVRSYLRAIERDPKSVAAALEGV